MPGTHLTAFATTPADHEAIPQAVLDIREKVRSNPLDWKGQFSPQFVEAILAYYQARGATRVLDPFAGSGTVLLEAARAGLPSVGLEVNPAAANLAQVYTLTRLSDLQREEVTRRLVDLTGCLADSGPLFATERPTDPADTLLAAWNHASNGRFVPGLPEATAALVTLADFYKRPLNPKKVQALRCRLIDLIRELPDPPRGGVEVRLADARATGLESSSIDLVLTSPPYINVYNYHQKYRASVEAMGWHVLQAARSEIGSNRKHRQNRILTVIQYCIDMAEVLVEMHRVIASGGMAVFVIGRESMVRKTAFFNGQILAEVATIACGFKLKLRQERVFRNKFGQVIYEDILHLSPQGAPLPADHRDSAVRGIARWVLEDALVRCPLDSREDIQTAIEAVGQVKSSRLLRVNDLRPTEG